MNERTIRPGIIGINASNPKDGVKNQLYQAFMRKLILDQKDYK